MNNSNDDIYKAYRNKYHSRRSKHRPSKNTNEILLRQYSSFLSHTDQNTINPNLNYPSVPPQLPQPAPNIGMANVGPVAQFTVPEDVLRQMDQLMKQNECLQSDIEYYKAKISLLEKQIYVFYSKLLQIESITISQPPPPNIANSSVNPNGNLMPQQQQQQQQQQSFQQICTQQQQQRIQQQQFPQQRQQLQQQQLQQQQFPQQRPIQMNIQGI